MASIKIKDTGYYNKTATGTQATVICNSGSVIDLTQTSTITMAWKTNQNSDPKPGSSATSDTNVVSFENRVWEIDLVLFKNVAADQTLLKHIAGVYEATGGVNSTYPGICATDGMKALYIYDTSYALTDGRKTIIEVLGDTSTSHHHTSNAETAYKVPQTIPCFLGYCSNLTVRDTSDGTGWRIHFTFTEA